MFDNDFVYVCVTGKGVNSWDKFSHEKGRVLNGDTGDIACDSYHKYEEDISMLKQLGVRTHEQTH